MTQRARRQSRRRAVAALHAGLTTPPPAARTASPRGPQTPDRTDPHSVRRPFFGARPAPGPSTCERPGLAGRAPGTADWREKALPHSGTPGIAGRADTA